MHLSAMTPPNKKIPPHVFVCRVVIYNGVLMKNFITATRYRLLLAAMGFTVVLASAFYILKFQADSAANTYYSQIKSAWVAHDKNMSESWQKKDTSTYEAEVIAMGQIATEMEAFNPGAIRVKDVWLGEAMSESYKNAVSDRQTIIAEHRKTTEHFKQAVDYTQTKTMVSKKAILESEKLYTLVIFGYGITGFSLNTQTQTSERKAARLTKLQSSTDNLNKIKEILNANQLAALHDEQKKVAMQRLDNVISEHEQAVRAYEKDDYETYKTHTDELLELDTDEKYEFLELYTELHNSIVRDPSKWAWDYHNKTDKYVLSLPS